MSDLKIIFNTGNELEPKPGLKLSQASIGVGNSGTPFAGLITHPSDSTVLGIKNESGASWNAITPRGTQTIKPGQTLKLSDGISIDFGFVQAVVTSVSKNPSATLAIGPSKSAQRSALPSQNTPGVIDLTPEEKSMLLWKKSDCFELACGNLSFTKSESVYYSSKFRSTMIQFDERTQCTQRHFIFEAAGRWGTREWSMCTDAQQFPNGPAILILYGRNGKYSPWGLISMINGAWIHCVPIDSVGYAKGSDKLRRSKIYNLFGSLFVILIIVVVGLVTCGVGATIVVNLTRGHPPFRDRFRRLTGLGQIDDMVERMEAQARMFMHRLANMRQVLWEGQNVGGGASGSKL